MPAMPSRPRLAGVAAYLFGPIGRVLSARGDVARERRRACSPSRTAPSTTTWRAACTMREARQTTATQPSGLTRAAHLPAAADLRRVRDPVPSRECGDAAAGRPEARAAGQEPRHQPDVGLHRRGAARDGADGDAGRRQGRRLGPQAASSSPRSRSCRCAARSTRCPTTRSGWSACSCSTASAPASSARSFPVIVADLMRGTGRFNVAQGAVATAQGIGAALSTTLAGVVVVQAGYSAAFLDTRRDRGGRALSCFGSPCPRPARTSRADARPCRTDPSRPMIIAVALPTAMAGLGHLVAATAGRDHAPVSLAGGDLGGGRRGAAGRARPAAGRRCARRHAQGHRRLSVPDRHDAARRARAARGAVRLAGGARGRRTRRARRTGCSCWSIAVGTVVTVFLSNDATAVVLTPAVYAATRAAGATPLPYLFVCAFIANAASFVLPISNPANLVIYGARMPPLLDWLRHFALPSLAADRRRPTSCCAGAAPRAGRRSISRAMCRGRRLSHGGQARGWRHRRDRRRADHGLGARRAARPADLSLRRWSPRPLVLLAEPAIAVAAAEGRLLGRAAAGRRAVRAGRGADPHRRDRAAERAAARGGRAIGGDGDLERRHRHRDRRQRRQQSAGRAVAGSVASSRSPAAGGRRARS